MCSVHYERGAVRNCTSPDSKRIGFLIIRATAGLQHMRQERPDQCSSTNRLAQYAAGIGAALDHSSGDIRLVLRSHGRILGDAADLTW